MISATAQVKIGDNHTTINAGSLLELESSNKGLLFPRVALNNDLTIWTLKGNDPADGMVVYNQNSTINALGLYCWYNNQWNHLSGGGSFAEFDSLNFNEDTRMLYDDNDNVNIASGRVRLLDTVDVLTQYVNSGDVDNPSIVSEGDIFYVSGDGLYIRNNVDNPTTVADGFIYIAAIGSPGRIMYANYKSVKWSHNVDEFTAIPDSFYTEPNEPTVLHVTAPDALNYYAFAVPSDWANPQISMKIKNSADDGFYKLNNCWNISREMKYDGILYQVWTLDIPMRKSAMHDDLEFMIE